MRWIDIDLSGIIACPESGRLLAEARTLADRVPALQERQGLDGPAITEHLREVGLRLFQAVTALQPEAFRPDADRPGARTPASGQADRDDLVGYHLLTPPDLVGVPWHWLHNGVAFLLETAPICAAEHGSRVPEVDPPRLWMQRHSHALFGLEPDQRHCPEILFVPGHGRDEIRRLMFREADGIDAALDSAAPASARLRIPGAVTPGLLASRAMLYQGLHFAAPTSQPPERSGAGENRWLAGLMAAAGHPAAQTVDELVGMEMEILGVDPVDSVLDHATAAYAAHGAPVPVGAGRGPSLRDELTAAGWLLDDGPVLPEQLGTGGLPPLIFSNSWCSLAWLGQRFRHAGSSTFVGTALPIYSRPARHFAALFYQALGSGLCCGEAHRTAALALRERLGPEHPAWLGHGLQGYGSLRLDDL